MIYVTQYSDHSVYVLCMHVKDKIAVVHGRFSFLRLQKHMITVVVTTI